MKSVSFSDLRDTLTMSNFDYSKMKKSSSIKQLTHYNSSEDILRRFSSKTEKILPKDSQNFEESLARYSSKNSEKILPKENPNSEDDLQRYSSKTADRFMIKDISNVEENKNEFYSTLSDMRNLGDEEQPKIEYQTSTYEKTIKELRDQLTQKNNLIANLQDENLILKNESTKNSEQVKFLENRIKYLEHTLDAFNTGFEEKAQQTNKIDMANKEKVNYNNSQNSVSSKIQGSRVNFEMYAPAEQKNYNCIYSKSRLSSDRMSNQEKITDLKKRPNSADSTLQTNHNGPANSYEDDSYHQTRQVPMKLYKSDSESNHCLKKFKHTSGLDNQKPDDVNYINFQRQKLERDRSLNLAEFKSRLDEFTKYAQQSAEQNSLRNSTSSLPQTNEYLQTQKRSTSPDKFSDNNIKNRVKSSIQNTRPPIDPYYKQRRNVSEIKLTDSLTSSSPMNQSTVEEDYSLKERVKKILDKHNYPSNNAYNSSTTDNSNINVTKPKVYRDEVPNLYSYKGYRQNDVNKPNDLQYSNYFSQYGIHSNSKVPLDDPNIPRLDLTLHSQTAYHPDDTSDLLEKYLNCQEYAHVS